MSTVSTTSLARKAAEETAFAELCATQARHPFLATECALTWLRLGDRAARKAGQYARLARSAT